LDSLGFIRPKQAFSKGCGDSKQKKSAPVSILLRKTSQTGFLSFLRAGKTLGRADPASEFSIAEDHSLRFCFTQYNIQLFRNSLSLAVCCEAL
jgi:hypothetical protein